MLQTFPFLISSSVGKSRNNGKRCKQKFYCHNSIILLPGSLKNLMGNSSLGFEKSVPPDKTDTHFNFSILTVPLHCLGIFLIKLFKISDHQKGLQNQMGPENGKTIKIIHINLSCLDEYSMKSAKGKIRRLLMESLNINEPYIFFDTIPYSN
jgi:hypothetical protein